MLIFKAFQMAVLIKVKSPKKGRSNRYLYYIVSNEYRGGKNKRDILESCGCPGEAGCQYATVRDINKRLAEINALEMGERSEITVSKAHREFLKKYKEEIGHTIKESTFKLHIENMAPILELIGKMKLKDISHIEIQWLQKKLKKPNVTNRTINMKVTELKKVFEYAAWGIKNPWIKHPPHIKRLPETDSKYKIVRHSREDVQAFLDSCTDDIRLALEVIFNGGLRPFEACSLKWAHIDFINRKIIIDNSGVNINKDLKISREVPLSDRLFRILVEERGQDKFGSYVIRYRKTQWLRQAVYRVVKRTGYKILPRELRKSFTSILLEEGAPLTTVQHILGHKSPETTARGYNDPLDRSKMEAINRL